MHNFQKGGIGLSFIFLTAIISLLIINIFTSVQTNNTQTPTILKQVIVTQQPANNKKTIQESAFKVYTTYAPTPLQTNVVSTTKINPIVGNNPHAGGYCSVSFLANYFGGDLQKAQVASCICSYESGGDPASENLSCYTNGQTLDYSIGLYQINLLAHCPTAVSATSVPYFCQILDNNALNSCTNQYLDPIQNIQKMVQISNSGTDWSPWQAEHDKGVCF